MKKCLPVLLFLFFILILNACDKSAPSSIEGKWKVINDSSIISGGSTSYNVYHGSDEDYFNFHNGTLYTKEASQLDTFTYKLTSAGEISISKPDGVAEAGPYTFKNSNVRIDIAPTANNPGFSFERIINLKR